MSGDELDKKKSVRSRMRTTNTSVVACGIGTLHVCVCVCVCIISWHPAHYGIVVVVVVEKSSESPSMIHRRHRCGHASLKSPAADSHKLKLLP